MHIMEPPDLFDKYLDPKFKDRVTTSVGPDCKPSRGSVVIDGLARSIDPELQQYRKRIRSPNAPPAPVVALSSGAGVISGSRAADTGGLAFAIERDYDGEAQVMGMEMEGIDIAVLFPSTCLSIIARDNMDPHLSLAICQAYNNWIHDFCQFSPDQLKFAAMLPLQDVNLACTELVRCVNNLGAVASFMRPNLVNGRYWHSNYWDPLCSLHENLDVAWGFHEGTGA